MNLLDRIVNLIADASDRREERRRLDQMLDRQDERSRARGNEYDEQAGIMEQIRREQGQR